MINWVISKLDLVTHDCYIIKSIEYNAIHNLRDIENLVDKVKQLEETVQCLSDENQKLMGMIYNKSTVNEILKGE